jgi:quinol monooxygenase YgiN
MSTEQVAVIAKITSKPGMRDDLARALDGAFPNVDKETDTTYYILHTDDNDENVLWMYELYTNKAALEAHQGAAWFKEWGPSLAPFMGGRPELIFMKPVGGKGL